jgi:hypothetical protein
VQEQWSKRSAKQPKLAQQIRNTLLETASERNDNTNKNLQKEKIVEWNHKGACKELKSVGP